MNNKKLFIITSHCIGGGLKKYCEDIILNLKYCLRDYEDYDFVTCDENILPKNNNHFDKEFKIVDHTLLIDYIIENAKLYDNIIFHFNLYPLYNKFTYNSLKIMFDNLNLPNLKLYITIHDFWWFCMSEPNLTIAKYNDLTLCQEQIEIITNIFNKAKLVIFATNKCMNKYVEKGIISNNFAIVKHLDIKSYNIKPYYPTINNNTIKILYVGMSTVLKGFHLLIDMVNDGFKLFKETHNIDIEIILLGNIAYDKEKVINGIKIKNYKTYEYDNFFNIINEIKPNVTLLISKCYETYSYTATLLMNTGIPIFYCNDVYDERIGFRNVCDVNNVNNIYSFNDDDAIDEKIVKFNLCLIDLVNKQNSDFIEVVNGYDIDERIEYDNIFNKDGSNFKN